jgi:hypothetical protein
MRAFSPFPPAMAWGHDKVDGENVLHRYFEPVRVKEGGQLDS